MNDQDPAQRDDVRAPWVRPGEQVGALRGDTLCEAWKDADVELPILLEAHKEYAQNSLDLGARQTERLGENRSKFPLRSLRRNVVKATSGRQ